jgi:cysteinyl-tRNA synthetase
MLDSERKITVVDEPGWHIEYNTMSVAHLGYFFLCSWWRGGYYISHHENEIAQISTACNDNIVPYWIHNGFVTVGAETMSESLGNYVTLHFEGQ